MVGVIIMEAMRMVILMTIAPPHQTRDDHGDEDEGCLGQDNNECFALKFVMVLMLVLMNGSLKGILHQKIFYRLNLLFWIVMGCGIARFGRRGLKTTET